MFAKTKIYYPILLCAFAYSKTIRSKIQTNENGTRELILNENSEVKQHEIDFLLKNLNSMNITGDDIKLHPSKKFETAESETTERKKEKDLNESILMKHWNSLTEVGWKNFTHPVKKMYINDTRILRLDPEFRIPRENGDGEEVEKESKETGKTMETAEIQPLKGNADNSGGSSELCRAVMDVCEMSELHLNREELIRCLTLKNETLLQAVEDVWNGDGVFECSDSKFLNETSESSEDSEAPRKSEGFSIRTLLRPRRLLHRVLLPLLVIMVIKYLVTLPFVAVSVFTLNAMWLGLLSLGAVMFAKIKNHHDHFFQKIANRRVNHIHGGEVYDVGHPLTGSEIYWSPIRLPITQSTIGTR